MGRGLWGHFRAWGRGGAEQPTCLGPNNQAEESFLLSINQTGNKAACSLFGKETRKKNALTMSDGRVRPYPGKSHQHIVPRHFYFKKENKGTLVSHYFLM